MRSIDISADDIIEVWPGRRLFIQDKMSLVALPKGYMSVLRSTISFGSGASAVHLTTTPVRARALFDAIVEMERPGEGVSKL